MKYVYIPTYTFLENSRLYYLKKEMSVRKKRKKKYGISH